MTNQEIKRESALYSHRNLVVCYLKASPSEQEKIIADYLRSPEILEDPHNWEMFFYSWLLEFCQKADTGPAENLLNFIKTTKPTLLPPDLQEAKREIFDPLFKLTNGKEKEIFENITQAGIQGVAQQLKNALVAKINNDETLPKPLRNQFLRYVEQLVKIEAGITSVGSAESKPKKPNKRDKGNRSLPLTAKPVNGNISSQPEIPPLETPSYSFSIALGPNRKPIKIEGLEDLTNIMKKIKGLPDTITAENIWQRLEQLPKMTPFEAMKRYGEQVAGGPFKGWRKIGLGKKWYIIFQIKGRNISFRVGPHEHIYATRRQKPRDRARSL